ncbi:MAG TPA: GGDEF domain-containing protein [Trebonia sp.]
MAETALPDTERLRPSVHPIGPGFSRGMPDATANISHRLALAWLAALAGDGGRVAEVADPAAKLPPRNSTERIVLTHQSARLISVLFGTPFDPDAAGHAGRALVALGFTGADVLRRSLRVLMLQLPMLIRALPGTGLPGVPADLEHRLAEVTGAFANGYVSALHDLTLAEQESIRRAELDAERAARLRLLHMATHDQLTGLPNRTAVFSKLSAVLRTASPGDRVGLCYLDLDGFKAVNDRYGHRAGDQLLAALAGRIERVARCHGALAARIGGDEFVVLAEMSPGLPGMIALATDILAEARRPVALTAGLVRVSACAGIVDRPAAGTTAECLVADADSALYGAKSSGGGRWMVHQPPRQRAS